jgi:hypothetical protein
MMGTSIPGSSAMAAPRLHGQGDGLTAFPDQAVRGEVSAPDGQIIWVGSHLQTKETAEWDERQPVRYILSKLGMLDKYRKR